MMVTVCIITDALSSVFISPDLFDTNSTASINAVGPSCLLQPVLQTVTACSTTSFEMTELIVK